MANSKKSIILVLALFLFFYVFISSLVLESDRKKSQKQFSTHAAAILGDVWALDVSGVSAYLKLALEANDYKKLAVVEQEGDVLAEAWSTNLEGIEGLFHRFGLIGVRHLEKELVYEQRKIGFLQGEQYILTVFTLINILVFLLLICLAVIFMLYLVSNRRQLERTVHERTQNLRESEKRFHDLVNLLPEMVWETDKKSNIRYANKAAIERFGLPDLQENDRSWFELIAPDQQNRARKFFKSCIQGHDTGLNEFIVKDLSGIHFPVLIRSVAMLQERKLIGTRSIIIDISERHLLEKELQRAQKMKAIGLMAGGVAHDLNNILSGVVSYPELMLMKLPEDSEIRELVEGIKQSGIRAAEVVSDLLTVARGVTATKAVHDINALIEEFLYSPELNEIKQLYPSIAFKAKLDTEAANVFCSPVHIRKCLTNLVVNGAEAISGMGQVTITSGNISDIPVSAEDAGEESQQYTFIKVTDSGSGLSEMDMGHIFEPFYTKKKMGRSGTGLGLTVVWNTMVDHDGSVEVSSNENETVFSLYFPSANGEIAEKPPKIDWRNFKGDNQSVLIVDDEKIQRDIAEKLLEQLGYQVASVSSGEAAVTLLEEKSYDVLLLDMLMDPGMNGLETFKKVCALYPKQKAVIASGYSKSAEVEETMRMGAKTYIAKPYTIEQLGRALSEVLQEN